MAKREYIQANKDWLEAKAKEEGVKALPKGIYYKVLSEGRSRFCSLATGGTQESG
jgi:FKBP-type peptidyl-prolyl cis-trans isomerase